MKKGFLILIPIFIIGFGFVFAQAQPEEPEERMCLMVITPAMDPTGVCINFSNSCIPEGWKKVDGCPETFLPVPELGNCDSQRACESYCALPENREPCLDFAEEHNMLPEDEIRITRKMLAASETEGPGGCQGQAECEAYCDDISHIRECIAFAEEHDLIPEDELEEARKVADALDQGLTPPNCTSKSECDVYCSQPENMVECITFGKAAGLIPPEELEEVEKVLAAIEQGVMPPPCGGKDECDAYCSEPEHLDECITFAEAAGFMSPEEAEMVRRTGGKGPGDCRGKDECEAYCDDMTHAEECMQFALDNGFIPQEDEARVRKMLEMGMTAGPGGCRSEEECGTLCGDPANAQICIDFAIQMGEMTPEEAEEALQYMSMMGQGGPGGCTSEEECRSYCDDPEHGQECFDFAVEAGMISSEEAEQSQRGLEMMMRGGPGGCQGEEECMAYCEDPDNFEECTNFSVEQGFMSSEEAGRMRGGMPQLPSEWEEEEWGEEEEGEMRRPPSAEEIEAIKQQEMQKAMEQMGGAEPKKSGEPCDALGTSRPCSSEIGACRIGVQICQQGVWGECMGGVMPQPEMCDGVDNDCDGQTDEDNVCIRGSQSFFEAVKNFLAGLVPNL